MLIVDAYNVLHVTGVLPPELSGMEVNELAALVAESRWGRHQVALVCDGTPPKPTRPKGPGGVGVRPLPIAPAPSSARPRPSSSSSVRVHYAGAGKSADACISGMINESTQPRRLTVVSNDRAVQRSATRRGSQVLSADTWLHQLALDFARAPRKRKQHSARPQGPLTPEQVDAWLAYFGVDS